MQGLLRFLNRVGSDIVAGKNIEAYVVSFVAVALALIGVIDDIVPDSVKFAAILAGVALLLFKSTAPEEKIPDLDAVLQDRQSFGPLREFLSGAQEVWFYGPSLINILRQEGDIKREVLDKGGKVRVLLQDPQSDQGMDILYQQLDKIHDLKEDIRSSLRVLENMRAWTGGGVEYGFVPYSPGFSLTIVDPDGKNGRLIIEFYGYQNELITERMHIEITRQQSQYWFEYWDNQYKIMWESRRKPDATTRLPANSQLDS